MTHTYIKLPTPRIQAAIKPMAYTRTSDMVMLWRSVMGPRSSLVVRIRMRLTRL